MVGDDTLSDEEVDDYDDDFDYEETTPVAADRGVSSKKETVICRCNVLYDFNSTQSSELTVKEG